jgi:hypothetical protein
MGNELYLSRERSIRWRFAELRDVNVLANIGGHRWSAMLESGEASSMKEIAQGSECTTATGAAWST